MNLASNCWFSQCYNTRILTAKIVTILFCLLIIQLTIYNRTITRFIADDNVVYQWVRREIRWLASDTELSTSFEACELEITVNYFSVYTWTENGSFMRNLTSWPMPFWLVLLTEHTVLHCYATNAVYRCLVAGQLYPSCGILFSKLSMLPSFQPLSGNSLNSLLAPYCFDR